MAPWGVESLRTWTLRPGPKQILRIRKMAIACVLDRWEERPLLLFKSDVEEKADVGGGRLEFSF
jgi:hypothetical protein